MPPKNKNKSKKESEAKPVAEPVKPAATTQSKEKVAPAKKNDAKSAPAVESKDSAAVLKEKGSKAFGNKDYPEALTYFNKAIEADSKNHTLYSNRSATYAALRQWEKALEDAETTIKLNDKWPKGYFRKGAALEGLLQYVEAAEAYAAGLALDANDQLLKDASGAIKTLLDELKMTAGHITKEQKEANPEGDKFDGMVRWMKEKGAKFPKLYLMYYSEDYRGVHCLTKIPTDDVILYVPLEIIMTSEVAKGSEIGKKIIASGCEVRSKHSYLAAYLLQERANPKSYWKPYIDILPVKYANMPVFFEEGTMQWLRNSMSAQKISDRIDSLRREYDNIRRHVPEFAKFTLEEFIWARFVVITRIFGLVIEGNKTDGLVPYADMLNHKKPCSDTGPVKDDEADTKWTYEDSRKGFIITTTRSIGRGDQVFDSYGRKCNSRFFVNYGFTLEDNEDNEVMIRVGLPPNDPHYQMKLRMLGGREHSARREFQIPASYSHKKVKELFSFMRFVNAVDAELIQVSAGENFKLEEIGPINIRNEKKALQDIHKAASEMYNAFPAGETLEHDNKLLASGELKDSNIRNCVVMRRGEKQVLRWFIDLAEKALPLLDMPWKDLKRTAAKSSKGTFEHYVNSVVVPLVKGKQ